MAHVITDACTKCFSCTEVCPVSCIHPLKDDPRQESVWQLCIDPEECIDCGACVGECPEEAIYPQGDLPADKVRFVAVNAAYFKS